MKNKIIIGEREKAYLGKSTYVFYFVLSFILLFFSFLFITFLFIEGKNPAFVIGFLIGMISFLSLAVIFLLLGLYRVRISKNNDSNENECLVYDENKNVFIFYDVFLNKEIEVEPKKIKRIIGSKIRTSNELYVVYIDSNQKIKKVNLGYCNNINHESFNNELMKIINPEDVGL